MDPDVEGIDLGFVLSFWNIIGMMMVVVVVVMVVMMMRIIMVVVSMIVIMVMMMIVSLLLIHFIRLLRVLKTRIFIVVVMVMMIKGVTMIVIVVPRTKRREGQPQHHQEQPQRNVNPVRFRLPLRFQDDGGLSPPTFGVIHPKVEGNSSKGKTDFCRGKFASNKNLHVTER